MARPPSDARQRALSAALSIVVRSGALALTMDAVAKEAGISKGGVLHHFPTKDALVRELVDTMTRSWEAAVEAQAESDPEPVGRYVRAFMNAMREPALAEVGRGLLGAVVSDAALLDPLRESFLRCQKRVAADGLDLATAYQCILVADAMWFNAIFALPPPPEAALTELRERLVTSTRPTSSSRAEARPRAKAARGRKSR